MPKLEPLNLRINGDSRGLSQALGRSERDTRNFADGVNKQSGKLTAGISSISAKAGAAGVAVTAAFASIAAAAATAYVAISKIRDIQGEIDETAKSADKLGIKFNELGALRLVIGESTGLDTGAIDSAIEKLLVNLTEAEKGSGRAFETLSKLGLDAGELIELGPVEALKRVAEETQKISNSTDQLKIAYDLFGRSGTAVVSTLRGGAEAIDEAARFQERWTGLTEAQVAAVEANNDAWGRVQIIVSGLTQELAAEVAPLMLELTKQTISLAEEFGGVDTIVRGVADAIALAAGLARQMLDDLSRAAKISVLIASKDFGSAAQLAFERASDPFNTEQIEFYFDRIAERRKELENSLRDAGPTDRAVDALTEQNEAAKETAANLDAAAEKLRGIRDPGSTAAVLRGSAEDQRARNLLSTQDRISGRAVSGLREYEKRLTALFTQPPKVNPDEADRQKRMVSLLEGIAALLNKPEPSVLDL